LGAFGRKNEPFCQRRITLGDLLALGGELDLSSSTYATRMEGASPSTSPDTLLHCIISASGTA
jgi:hypothetical protein